MAKKMAVKAKKSKKSAKRAVSKKKSVKKAAKAVKKPVKAAKVKEAPVFKLSGTANLLATYDPNHRGTAMQELKDAFKIMGEKLELSDSGVEGLFKLKVPDAKKAVGKLSSLCRKNHNAFVATHHYVPIDKWCKSEVSEMQRTIKSLIGSIGNNEKWKMSLNRRKWDKMGGVELILKLTDVIDRPKVDLNNPQKIVQVEIIGAEAGISVLTPNELLDVQKLKAEH